LDPCGAYDVDVYQVNSGQRVLAMEGKFGGGINHLWMFRRSGWISDSYYIFPQDESQLRQFVFCDFGKLVAEAKGADGKKGRR
jgi:hypothetical protein